MNAERLSSPGPQLSAPNVQIEVRSGDTAPQIVQLDKARLVIGRAANAAIRLDHDTVSRYHTELVQDPFGRWWIRDLGSRNGTKLNGARVKESLLTPGQIVKVGRYDLRLISKDDLRLIGDVPPIATLPVIDSDDHELSGLDTVESPKVAASQLSAILELGERLCDLPNAQDRLRLLCDALVRDDFRGRAAMVIRLRKTDADSPPQILFQAMAPDSKDHQSVYISRGTLRRALQTGEPVLASNTSRKADVQISIAPNLNPLSAAACPLHSGEQHIDLLYVVLHPEYGLPEWLALVTLAVKQYQLAESIRNQASIEADLAMARRIQKALLPKPLPGPGIEACFDYTPCRWVGGDYVDIIQLSPDRLFLAVGDVCGKGLQGALVASSIHTLMRTSLLAGASLEQTMQLANQYVTAYLPDARFVSMAALIVDMPSGRIESVNAGHPSVLAIARDGALRELEGGDNVALGIQPGPLNCASAILEKGDALAIYSDGWTDLQDPAGEMLGTQRVNDCIARTCAVDAKRPLGEVLKSIVVELDAHAAACLANDDRTLVLARRI